MKKIYYGWWIVLASFLIASYVGGIIFFGFTAFFEPVVNEFGWSHTQVSIAFSLRGLEMGILAPVIGFLVDRFGSRALALSGALIVGFALILLSLTNSLLMFYTSFALLALGGGGCAPTVLMTVVANWFRKNVGKAMGVLSCGFGAGGILLPLIVWLIDSFHWRTALIILGLGMWAIGIPLAFVIRHNPEQIGSSPDGEAAAESKVDDRGCEKGEVHFNQAIRGGNFWRIGIAEGIRSMIVMGVVTHVMPYLSSTGMARTRAAFVATSIPLFSLVGRLGFGWLSDFFDKRYIFAWTLSLIGMGMLAFSYIQVRWLIFPFLLFFCPAFGGTVPLRGTILREYFGRTSFGRLLGIVMGMGAMGGMIGTFVAGWTFDRFKNYRPIWLSFAGMTIVSIILVLRIKAGYPASRE